MAKSKRTAGARLTKTPKRQAKSALRRSATTNPAVPVTLKEAKALALVRAPKRATRRASGVPAASPASVGAERERLREQQRLENERRIREYKATLQIMKRRGVKGLSSQATRTKKRPTRGGPAARRVPGTPAQHPLQIFAEGDSWFDYPVPFFGGGIIPRLEAKLGVPILNLAKAGDEVRFMLGVEERKILSRQFTNGCPAGGPWDVLLFSGGGNDIVDNPMALWIRDFDSAVPPAALIEQSRFDAALALVRAGYEDLIAMRDTLSAGTHLIFHGYDFAIPDGRKVCHLGPWLKPTLDLRKFPVGSSVRFEVVKAMLKQFATMLLSLESHAGVTFINGQGTLSPVVDSWHNELHPSKAGFKKFATLFHAKLKALFPTRVL